MVTIPPMRIWTTNLARSLFVCSESRKPRSQRDAVCLVVLEKVLTLIHDQRRAYVFPEDLIGDDQIERSLVEDALTELKKLKLLACIVPREDEKMGGNVTGGNVTGGNTKKRGRSQTQRHAWTTSYHAWMDVMVEYCDAISKQRQAKSLATRTYVCKVCNATTWAPEKLKRVSEVEWELLEAQTKGTPRNLWKCNHCKYASVQLDAQDAFVHGSYDSFSSTSEAAYHPLIGDLKVIVRGWKQRGLNGFSDLAKEIAKQDLHWNSISPERVEISVSFSAPVHCSPPSMGLPCSPMGLPWFLRHKSIVRNDSTITAVMDPPPSEMTPPPALAMIPPSLEDDSDWDDV